MVIYGASGHGKVIFDILRSRNIKPEYILDDNPAIADFMDYRVIHTPHEDMLRIPAILAIGDNTVRKHVACKYTGNISEAVSHSFSIISKNVKIGDGTVVMPGAIINADTFIGIHCIINSGAVVEHDVHLNDFVHISPNAVITGNVTIGEGSQIGAGASVIPGVKIGKWVNVGAGAVVIEDIPDFAVVVGNPGKIIKYLNEG